MIRIAIVGGGISGLTAAFTLEEQRRAGAVEYILYESSPRFGGVLRTERIHGCIVEAGPDSFITEKPWAADLCRTIDLGDKLIGSNDADRKTYILVRGRLIPMPDGLMFMVPTKILSTGLSPLFSWSTKLRMAQELFHSPRAAQTDESVASLVERHYGAEMVGRLADPLLSFLGTNDQAGDYRSSGCTACHVIYANDRDPGNVISGRQLPRWDETLGRIKSDDLSDWVLIWPETARKRPIHNGYRLTALRVLLKKESSIQHRNMQ